MLYTGMVILVAYLVSHYLLGLVCCSDQLRINDRAFGYSNHVEKGPRVSLRLRDYFAGDWMLMRLYHHLASKRLSETAPI